MLHSVEPSLNRVDGATVFPANIGLGASRDADLVQRVGRATAEELSATGVDWTFAPCLCVARDDRWVGTAESFGEKPEIANAMTTHGDRAAGRDAGRSGLGAGDGEALRRRRRRPATVSTRATR